MEFFISNFGASVRYSVHNGREYLVAPVTMIVPGVLPGSKGPLYYPKNEIQNTINDWEGIPLTLNHPADESGQNQSITTAGMYEKFGIGVVRKPRMDPKNTAKAEAWLDIEMCQNKAPKLLERVKQGEKIEVSTGLFTDNIPAHSGASYNGRVYTHIARNYKPDHLAILLDQPGACSVKDGCGLNTNSKCTCNSNPEGCNQHTGPGCSVSGGKEDSHENKVKSAIVSAKEAKAQFREKKAALIAKAKADVAALLQETRSKAASAKNVIKEAKQIRSEKIGALQEQREKSRSALTKHMVKAGDHFSKLDELTDELPASVNDGASKSFWEVQSSLGVSDSDNYHDLKSYHQTVAQHLPILKSHYENHPEVPSKTKQAISKAISKIETEHAKASEAIKASKGLSTKIKQLKSIPMTLNEALFNPELQVGSMPQLFLNSKGNVVKLTPAQRFKAIQVLTTNCDCWKSEDDKETLNAMSDPQLVSLIRGLESMMAVNQLRADLELDDTVTINAMPEFIKEKMAEKEDKKTKNKKTKNGMTEDDEEEETDNKKVKNKKVKNVEIEVEDDNEEEEEDKTSNKKVKNKKSMTANDWLDAAPPEIKSVVSNALKVEQAEKNRLVEKLVANYAGDPKQVKEYLGAKSLGELRMLVGLIPTQEPAFNHAPTNRVGGFLLNGVGDFLNNGSNNHDDDILDIPVMNYGKDQK